MTPKSSLACACGAVRLETEGAPIISTECHCKSCHAAGQRLEKLPDMAPFREADGSTRYVCFRKDRVRFLSGTDRLAAHRLSSKAPTRRVVATCCNTPVFLEFANGHWLSLYSVLWPEKERPLPDLRTMTGDLPAGTELSAGVPSSGTHTMWFYYKLLAAWIAMGFRQPKIEVSGAIDA